MRPCFICKGPSAMRVKMAWCEECKAAAVFRRRVVLGEPRNDRDILPPAGQEERIVVYRALAEQGLPLFGEGVNR